MEREQIIKALEIHSDKEDNCMGKCPYSGRRYCGSGMAKDALSLIKELIEENERLRDTAYRLECEVHRERANTVRKMQELIFDRLDISVEGYSTEEVKSDVCDMVYQIAKEMVEGIE